MNAFYSIAPENTNPKDEFQLDNLGKRKEIFSGIKRNNDPFGARRNERHTVYDDVNKEDYDGALASKISRFNPPYELDNLINYHLDFYVSKGGHRDKFIKHIQYVVFPYMEKWYEKEKAHIELTRQWIENVKRKENIMIEYTDLTDIEKHALNTFIASTDQGLLSSNSLWLNKTEIDGLFSDDTEYHSKRLVDFLLTNDFIKLRTYNGTYFIEPEGRKLFKYGSAEKYYEKQQTQFNQANPSIVGHGNIVNIAGGNIHQSNITITISQEEYDNLRKLGVEEKEIEELKQIVSENKNDKPSLLNRCTKWSGEVMKQVAIKGLIENLPAINDFVTHLINTIHQSK